MSQRAWSLAHTPARRALQSLLADGRWWPDEDVRDRIGSAVPGQFVLRLCQHAYELGIKGFANINRLDESAVYYKGRAHIAGHVIAKAVGFSVLRRTKAGSTHYWWIPMARLDGSRLVERRLAAQYVEIPLNKVSVHPDIQPRPPEEIDGAVARKYAADLAGGADFPPVIVYRDEEGNNWLADGHYRLEAHRLAGKEVIPACVFGGTVRDAMLFACQANEQHGARRGDGSRKRVVLRLLADPEWSKESDHWIAKACGVHQTFVSELRRSGQTKEQSLVPPPTPEPEAPKKRTVRPKNRDPYEIDVTNIGKGKRRKREEAPAAPEATPVQAPAPEPKPAKATPGLDALRQAWAKASKQEKDAFIEEVGREGW